jgi:hypothetical protein
MKLFKYSDFLKESNEDIDSICKKYGIENYTAKEGLVHVDGDVDLSRRGLTKLPLKFGEVSGYFDCSRNQLTSLEGAPSRVRNFNCSQNQLTSLKGGPKVRGTYYLAYNNQLINFYGFPEDGWEGEVGFFGNPVGEILDLFPRERQCEAIDWIVEFDVLYSTVVPFMYLEAVFERMNLPVPEDKIYNLKNYEII